MALDKEETNFVQNQKVFHTYKKEFCDDDKNKKNVRDHCRHTGKFRGATHSECNLRYNELKEIPVIIHNAAYETHFIINQLAIELAIINQLAIGELNCIGDNMEKYITFSVPIKKELNNGKIVTYKLKFIDSYRFMQSSLSDLVDNTSEVFKSKECISCTERKKIIIQNVVLLD